MNKLATTTDEYETRPSDPVICEPGGGGSEVSFRMSCYLDALMSVNAPDSSEEIKQMVRCLIHLKLLEID